MSNTTYSTTSTEKLLSACGGALVTSLMVTPMDVVKMRMQTQNVYSATTNTLSSKAAMCCMAFNNCTQSIKHGLQNNRITRGGQLANIYQCTAFSEAAAVSVANSVNSPAFKGTFVRGTPTEIFFEFNILRLFSVFTCYRTDCTKSSNMKVLQHYGKDCRQHCSCQYRQMSSTLSAMTT